MNACGQAVRYLVPLDHRREDCPGRSFCACPRQEPGSHYWEKGKGVIWEPAGVFAGDTECGPEVEEYRAAPQGLRVRL